VLQLIHLVRIQQRKEEEKGCELDHAKTVSTTKRHDKKT
jgi:hypothetical protein